MSTLQVKQACLRRRIWNSSSIPRSSYLCSLSRKDFSFFYLRLLLVRVSGIMLQSWVHTAYHTTGSCSVEGRSPLEIVTGRVPDISRYFRFPFGCPSSLTRLKSAIITTRPRARSESLSVALLDSIALSLSLSLVKVLAHGSIMMCENTRSLPKALRPNWRRSLSVPSSAKTGPQFSFRMQPPRLPGDFSVPRSHG